MHENRNKRGKLIISSSRRVKALQGKLSELNIEISVGTLLNLLPFFISFATEKEMTLCLCKICLNTKLLFDPLQQQAKKDNDKLTESISNFFMHVYKCSKAENSDFKLKCVDLKCSDCKSIKPMHFKCADSLRMVKVSQSELTKIPYKKLAQGEMVEKVSNKTEKVTKEMSFKDLYTKIVPMKKKYTTHKYEVYNNVFHWPSILSTTKDHGEIFHIYYSENLSQQYKFEPQSSHFSKRQFSLHCTVKHTTDPNNLHLYKYCLSDEMKHDHIFTTTVSKQLIEESSSDIICIKSDNSSTQYKSKYIFKSYISLAAEISKPVIAFYGTWSWQRASRCYE